VSGATAAATASEIERLGFTHALVIPDSESRLLVEALESSAAVAVITPCREGESIAIAAGLWTGGAKPLLIIQNTGVMESGDALRGCGVGPRIPLRMLVGWRGYPGAMAGRLPIDSAYTYTEPILDAWGIPTWHLMSDADLGVLEAMDRTAAKTSFPAAVISGHRFS
jgi:sulfopyruvate decarboxylase TPP-binding subunit